MKARPLPPVSLRQLQYIVSVAELGGFRRAAELCRVAQPSLSAQVAQAEAHLGVRIFERDRRHVRVSSAGSALVSQARAVLTAAAQLRELARHLSDPFRGTLHLGVIPTVGPYVLPDVSPALSAAFPHLRIIWTEDRTGALARQLEDGTLDAALLALEADVGGLDHAPLGRDRFVLAASPGHPLMRSRRPASPRDLEGETVLLLNDGHCFRDQALGICARSGASELGFRATSLATLVQMVSAGRSVTLLPSLALAVENRRGQLRVREFAAPGPGRTLVVAWRRGSALAGPLRQIVDAIRPALAGTLSRVGAPRARAAASGVSARR